MKLKYYEIVNDFKDFKSLKIKSDDKYNRKLYAVKKDRRRNTENLTRIYFLKRDGEVSNFFTREEITEIIGSLMYGDYEIIKIKRFLLFSRYYVVYKNNLLDLTNIKEYPKEEYFSIREKPKRK